MIEKMSFNQLIRLRQNKEYFEHIKRRFDSVNGGNVVAVPISGNNIFFEKDAKAEYSKWQQGDGKMVKMIEKLILSIQKDGLLAGCGNPEKLENGRGYSRNIDLKNNLVYDTDENENLIIVACEGHYYHKEHYYNIGNG